jgi:aquaporin Z
MMNSLRKHWPEYLMEAAELGIFMVSACSVVALLEYPGSTLHQFLPNPVFRRVLTGIAMGLTAICIVYSPWGKQSGAHFNPSFTLTFFRLGKIRAADAFFYILFQFAGGLAGVLLSLWLVGSPVRHPSVNYVATTPGPYGLAAAFAGELLISFLQMTIVLKVSNHSRLARFTGVVAGGLVATYISIESPLSGMSMNPARTFASAFPGQLWAGSWIYFTAPLLGMLSAAEVYLWKQGKAGINCAKLHHQNNKRCIFCEYQHRKAIKAEPAAAKAAIAF